MKRLLALTAGASAVAACSKGYAVVDPMPIPATATIGPPVGPPDAGEDLDAAFGPPIPTDLNVGTIDAGHADAGADAGAKKKKATAPVPSRGYMVVDPLPPPPPHQPSPTPTAKKGK